MSDEPTQAAGNDDADAAECGSEQEGVEGRDVDTVERIMHGHVVPQDPPGTVYHAAEAQAGDVVVSMGQSRYPMPPQADGWQIPASMREYALAILWRVMRSKTAVHLTKIRAIEALVRIDGQSLATERQEDWRSVQSSNSNRSNIRVLAEMNRNKSQAKSLPKPRKS